MNRRKTMQYVRPLVADRAAGLCENNAGRCWASPSELHHVLPRSQASRGDVHLLDLFATQQGEQGEDVDMPWLAFLCVDCHRKVHAEPAWAREVGLMANGTVSARSGRPVYQGTDVRLTEMFGPDDEGAPL